MKLIYRDYEYPSIYLRETGYITFEFDNQFDNEYCFGKFSEYDDIKYIKSKDNINYFEEADILTKINLNEDHFFDFNKSIIDIGANVGCYSIRSNFNYIYAFEPNEKIYHLLCTNLIMHNRYDISKVYNVLLSDKHEIINFDGFSAVSNNQHDIKNNVYLNSYLLDEYDCENVGLIKVDVEGMEEKVLKGGIGTIIRNNYPPILFELWDVGNNGMTTEKHDSLEKFLTDLGYHILWYWGNFQTHLAIHN